MDLAIDQQPTKTTTGRPMGRPVGSGRTYNEGLANLILQRYIENGGRFRLICNHPLTDLEAAAFAPWTHFPDIATVYRWLARHDTFREAYARAWQASALSLEQVYIDAIECREDDFDDHGKVDRQAIERTKIKAQGYQWLLARRNPRLFGDKLDVTNHNDETKLTEAQVDAAMARALGAPAGVPVLEVLARSLGLVEQRALPAPQAR